MVDWNIWIADLLKFVYMIYILDGFNNASLVIMSCCDLKLSMHHVIFEYNILDS